MAVSEPRGWFAVPAPVRELFKVFPLHILPAAALPQRSPDCSRPRLHVFARGDDDARAGRPSFNPACLKWQTLLRVARVDVDLVPSNNHASPSGALPFLLPARRDDAAAPARGPACLTGNKLLQYAREHAPHKIREDEPVRLEAYQALLAQHIRPAWLYTLYLAPANDPLLTSLYLPSSLLLRLPLRHTLHAAATEEILKATRRQHLAPAQLYTDAAAALGSLSTLLGDDEWFFAGDAPGVFDAEVFAYTYLILDESLDWRDRALAYCLLRFDNLVQHRSRLYQRCWES
ncbi:hypothetical protein S7711_04604 [Stachybotrys chartarum IBT 7711]|uniref:Thioredoxin-like fold domain-containing protein n=1 Tax=Stachybotrys chartarum (strain CBS 109288 / IBT 7711) TaxID=1280523 RepID=A0A084AUF9_STACB|nr:hypothetical protein S7711_04604 [Stachybotrys chartarum IBT 7711]